MSSYDEIRCAELLDLPPHGSELFISGLPPETTEESLRKLCSPLQIDDIKLKDNGCAYVTFTNKVTVDIMKEIKRKNKVLQLSLVPSDHWLIVRNVPKNLSKEELTGMLGPGVMKIENNMGSHDLSADSASFFVDYRNNACAEYAKKKLSASDFKLQGNQLAISWASVPPGAKKPKPAHNNLPVDPYGAYGCGPGTNKPKRVLKEFPHYEDGYIVQDDPYVPQPSSTQRGDRGSGPSGNVMSVKRARK